MKIIVYAISKNEEKFVSRWVKSMSEADEIYVLDTGSTDNTVKLLKDLNVHVSFKKFDFFRFDSARNASLELVPLDTDICVCTDLDEVFLPGWREKLEKMWSKNTNRIAYNYNWSLKDNVPLVNFYIEKIHSRFDYIWVNPVHEILKFTGSGKENKKVTDEITLNHYPDPTKSRGSYLKLLELSVKENPFDDRNTHYLGREYMYYRRWNKAIDTLIRHLKLESATWKDERCASMRFIARCYKNLKRYDEAEMWLLKAIKEAPYLRDPYIELALLYYDLKDYKNVKKYVLKALKIKSHPKTYINEVFSFDFTPYDLLSISYYYLGEYKKSLYYVKKALKINPEDERIQKNLLLIKEKVKELC